MQTERTILTLLNRSDFDDVLKMYSEPDTFKYIEPLLNRTKEEYITFLESRIAQIKSGAGYHWVVRSRDNNEFIGLMNLNPIGNTDKIQVGFQLKRKFWNQGLATELTIKVLDFASIEAKLRDVYGVFNSNNIASAKIFKKLKFDLVEKRQIEGEDSPIEIWKYSIKDNAQLKSIV